MSELNKKQIMEMEEAFAFFDQDGNGTITVKELNTVMNSLGYYPTEEQSNAMRQKVRSFGRETIDFPLFLNLVKSHIQETNYRDEIKDAFQIFDRNSSGYIRVEELRHLLTTQGIKLSGKEVDELLEEVYIDHHGRIKYKDLLDLLTAK